MGQPHFIVFANEKGGTGKSTTAVHTAIALAASGHRVGALDLDQRQRTMTRYLENRDATTRSASTLAASIRAICPACSAPMVGTSAIISPASRQGARAVARSLNLLMICMRFRPSVFLVTGAAHIRAVVGTTRGIAGHGPAALHRLRQ